MRPTWRGERERVNTSASASPRSGAAVTFPALPPGSVRTLHRLLYSLPLLLACGGQPASQTQTAPPPASRPLAWLAGQRVAADAGLSNPRGRPAWMGRADSAVARAPARARQRDRRRARPARAREAVGVSAPISRVRCGRAPRTRWIRTRWPSSRCGIRASPRPAARRTARDAAAHNDRAARRALGARCPSSFGLDRRTSGQGIAVLRAVLVDARSATSVGSGETSSDHLCHLFAALTATSRADFADRVTIC